MQSLSPRRDDHVTCGRPSASPTCQRLLLLIGEQCAVGSSAGQVALRKRLVPPPKKQNKTKKKSRTALSVTRGNTWYAEPEAGAIGRELEEGREGQNVDPTYKAILFKPAPNGTALLPRIEIYILLLSERPSRKKYEQRALQTRHGHPQHPSTLKGSPVISVGHPRSPLSSPRQVRTLMLTSQCN